MILDGGIHIHVESWKGFIQTFYILRYVYLHTAKTSKEKRKQRMAKVLKAIESENLRIFEQFRSPPDYAMSKISGGTMKGKTDIDPMWRLEALTEMFGPIGEGWYYDVIRLWLEQAGEEVCSFAEIKLYYKLNNGDWSKPVYGIGGNRMIKSGHVSDECFKMATTDAIGVACKSLGIGADVYYGKFEDSKYLQARQEKMRQEEAPKCKICKQQIVGIKTKTGNKTAIEIAKLCEGMCFNCWDAARKLEAAAKQEKAG